MNAKVFWTSFLYWGILLVLGCSGVGLIVFCWMPPSAVRILSPTVIQAFWRTLGWSPTDILTWRWSLLFIDAVLFCFWASFPSWSRSRLHWGPLRGVYQRCQQYPVLILIGLLLMGHLVLFADFLVGNKRFCFIDIAGDSVSQVMPETYYFTNVYQFNQLWMHESVLGNNIFTFPMTHNIFDPLLHLVFFRTTIAGIADRMAYYVILQSLIAGIGCYGFLRRSNRTPAAAMISALSYSFCGAFLSLATWGAPWAVPMLPATAIVLWAFKVWQQKHHWGVLLVALAYFIISTPMIVSLYQLAVFLLLYVSFDWLISVSAITRASLRQLIRRLFQLAVIGCLAVLSLAIIILPHGYYMLSENYRSQTTMMPFFLWPPLKELFAIFLRLFSNDLVGTANHWTVTYQYSNYLELPFLYNGLFVLITISALYLVRGSQPQMRKELAAVSLLFVPVSLTLLVPGLRAYLFYGGKLTYFRWMCMFVTATFVIVGAYALDVMLASARIPRIKISMAVAAGIWLVGLGICYLGLTRVNWRILDLRVFRLICVALVGYPILFFLPNPQLRQACLIIATLSELVWQGHHTITEDRMMLRHAASYSLQHTNAYTYPPMIAALTAVKNDERQPLFRLSKTAEYDDIDSENTALCQLYYGTRGYTSFNNKYTVAFFLDRQIRLDKPELARGLPGFQDRHVLDNLVGVKYYLKRNELPVPPWAQPVTSIADVNVFVNPHAFPPGVIYHDYLWQSELDALPVAEDVKDNLFMLAAVLPEKLDVQAALNAFEIPHLDQPLPKITNTSEVLQAIHDKQANGVELLTFSNDVITGQFTTSQAGVLFFSIPFDSGWHLYLDDQEIEKFPVNIGFLGAFVPGGRHTVKLVYLPWAYQVGKIISLCTLGFIGLSLVVLRISARRTVLRRSRC